jgi:hypothetical protein
MQPQNQKSNQRECKLLMLLLTRSYEDLWWKWKTLTGQWFVYHSSPLLSWSTAIEALPPRSLYAIRTRYVWTVAISYLLPAALVLRPGYSRFWRKTSYISVHIGGSPRRSRGQTFALPTFLHSTPRLLRLQQWTIHSLKGKGYAYTLKNNHRKILKSAKMAAMSKSPTIFTLSPSNVLHFGTHRWVTSALFFTGSRCRD